MCRDCGVVFRDGRWQWSPELPTGAADALCPACQRIRDQVPAGFLTLSGDFLQPHREEIMHLLRNTVDAQQKEIPIYSSVMDKIGKPRGLVRFDSSRGFETGQSRMLRPRFFIYAVLILAMGGLGYLIYSSSEMLKRLY